jgi:hypothetical protein
LWKAGKDVFQCTQPCTNEEVVRYLEPGYKLYKAINLVRRRSIETRLMGFLFIQNPQQNGRTVKNLQAYKQKFGFSIEKHGYM